MNLQGTKYEVYALISITIAIAGQLAMKTGMSSFSSINTYNFESFLNIFFNKYVILGLTCYLASLFIWLKALKGLPLSYAFPLQSFGTVLIFLFSWLLLRENISFQRWLGFFFLIAGLIFLTNKKVK